ncbi:hypothetical protein ES703_88578 [subsurface metagenome]
MAIYKQGVLEAAAVGGDSFLVVAAADTPATLKARADYVGDGTHDMGDVAGDEAEINTALGIANTVILCPGTYWINNPITLATDQSLIGGGAGIAIKLRDGKDADIYLITTTAQNQYRILVSRLKVDGNAGLQTAGNQTGIYLDKAYESRIENCWVGNLRRSGITLDDCDECNVVDNHVTDITGARHGIYLIECTSCAIVGNVVYGVSGSSGICLYDTNCKYNVVSGNVCSFNGDNGIYIHDATGHNTITGNTCYVNVVGIYILITSYDTVAGNTCNDNTGNGITLNGAIGTVISGNNCHSNGAHGIGSLGVPSDCNISGNHCHSNVATGLAILGDGNRAINNRLENNATNFSDGGTNTQLATYVVPLSDGSDPQDSGFLIDAADEYAKAWMRLPAEVQQVVRMKVYARSVVLEADKMRLEFVIEGGADNEAYTTHTGSVANHPSTSGNFAADDIIFWTVTEAGVLALVGGDSVEVKVLHEEAGNGDCATNAYIRTVEIEYV